MSAASALPISLELLVSIAIGRKSKETKEALAFLASQNVSKTLFCVTNFCN